MNTSRKKYRRSLQVHGLVRLVLLGAISALVGGAFVIVKNRQHALANEKGALNAEIVSIDRAIKTLEMRITALVDSDAIAAQLPTMGEGLVAIDRVEKIFLIAGAEPGAQFASHDDGGRSEQDEL